MKKTIRSAACILTVIFALTLTASCSRKPYNSEAFRKIAKEKGYMIKNITAQYVNAPQIQEVFVALSEDGSYQIEFYVLTDRDSAMKHYQVQSDVIISYQGKEIESKVSNGKNYARRAVIAENGNFLLLSYVENTVIYVPPTSTDNKETIEAFLDELNY